MSLIYVFVAAAVFVAIYKLVVASNRRNLSQGREFIFANTDPLEFLRMPVRDIESESELAGFNYLVMKPWKETRQHFHPYMSKYKSRALLPTESERGFMEAVATDMGITDAFVLAAEMVPLPESIGDLDPLAFGAWTDLHKQTMNREPHRTIGSFVGISSSAASEAITARLRHAIAARANE